MGNFLLIRHILFVIVKFRVCLDVKFLFRCLCYDTCLLPAIKPLIIIFSVALGWNACIALVAGNCVVW